MSDDAASSGIPSCPSLLENSGSDYALVSHRQPPQARKIPAGVVKVHGVVASPLDKRIPTILNGGDRLGAYLSELNSITKVPHTLTCRTFTWRLTTDVGEYIPITMQVGIYNAAHKPKANVFRIEQKLELWVHHTRSQKSTLEDPAPVSCIELVAYNKDEQHVSDLPGLGTGDTWAVKKKQITFLPSFAHVRAETELCCLVHYCLLLAAVKNLYHFDGISVPREPRFASVLVEPCKRKWEDERLETFNRTGILPDENDIWDGAVKLDVQKARQVQQYSTLESEGEDEIPAMIPKSATQHLNKR